MQKRDLDVLREFNRREEEVEEVVGRNKV